MNKREKNDFYFCYFTGVCHLLVLNMHAIKIIWNDPKYHMLSMYTYTTYHYAKFSMLNADSYSFCYSRSFFLLLLVLHFYGLIFYYYVWMAVSFLFFSFVCRAIHERIRKNLTHVLVIECVNEIKYLADTTFIKWYVRKNRFHANIIKCVCTVIFFFLFNSNMLLSVFIAFNCIRRYKKGINEKKE